jgi:tetratricopeptide (TPR) repeat protein
MKSDEILQNAMAHYQARRLGEAEESCRQLLAADPDHAQALHLLAVLSSETGKVDLARELMSRLIQLRPDSGHAQNNLAQIMRQSGRLEEALAAHRRAVELSPHEADFHFNLGCTLIDMGQVQESIAALIRAGELNPDHAKVNNLLGIALRKAGRLDEAIAAFGRAVWIDPNSAEAYNNLGNALTDRGQYDRAIAAYRQAIALRPDYREALRNMGSSLRAAGRFDEALAALRKVTQEEPNDADAHNRLGVVLGEAGKIDQAVAAGRKAVAMRGATRLMRWHLAVNLLKAGKLREGFAEYEARWGASEDHNQPRQFGVMQWAGHDLAGRRILLYAEQGIGDTIQFARYVPLVANRGGRIVLECQGPLARLLRPLKGVEQIILPNEPADREIGAIDTHCPLMTLPMVFGTTLDTIPNQVPYLHADAALVRHWRQRVGKLDGKLKIGLNWAGNPDQKGDRHRSTTLSKFAPLAAMGDAVFVSLHKGTAGGQATKPPRGLKLVDWTDELSDFAETAALIENLDLVITTDTSVPHLAGAMGKPVWVLLPFAADWRWMMEREDSPWYPTMRLFRQKKPGDWAEVVRRVAQSLGEWQP